MKGFPKFNCLLPVTDKSSKRTILIPGHTKYKAEYWGDLLVRELMLSDWGILRGIISDRDRKFMSELWDGMWRALGTRLLMTAAYHPEADGPTDRKNQTVEIAIRFYNYTNPEASWLELIPALQWNLKSAYSDTIKLSPHEELFSALDLMTDTNDTQPELATRVTALRNHLRQDAQLAMNFAAAAARR